MHFTLYDRSGSCFETGWNEKYNVADQIAADWRCHYGT
jgi:hypothetical protein